MHVISERPEHTEQYNLPRLRKSVDQLLASLVLAWIAQSNGQPPSLLSATFRRMRAAAIAPPNTLLLSSEAMTLLPVRKPVE